MELKDQVCGLELAKKLKELGMKQKSLWWWVLERHSGGKPVWILLYNSDKFYKEWVVYHNRESYSAFTVAELGEVLPLTLFEANCMSHLSINKHSKKWSVSYLYNSESSPDLNIKHNRNMTLYGLSADTLANAMAKMLICLLENKIEEG